jgi:hypothetical protein
MIDAAICTLIKELVSTYQARRRVILFQRCPRRRLHRLAISASAVTAWRTAKLKPPRPRDIAGIAELDCSEGSSCVKRRP